MEWFKRWLAEFLWGALLDSSIEVRKLNRNDSFLFLLPESTTDSELENFRMVAERLVKGEYAIILSDKTNIIGFE